MTRPEKPSRRRRLAQFACSHYAWDGWVYYAMDGTTCVTVMRCMACGYMTWERTP
jgi:hypothetical protein